VCVCVCVFGKERERVGEGKRDILFNVCAWERMCVCVWKSEYVLERYSIREILKE